MNGRHIIHFTNRPLSRRLDRCDRVIQDEYGDCNGSRGLMCNMSQCELRPFRVNSGMLNVIRIVTYSLLYITPVRVARLVLDCNGVFAIQAYIGHLAHDVIRDEFSKTPPTSRFCQMSTLQKLFRLHISFHT